MPSTSQPGSYRRHAVGIVAIVFLAAGVGLWLFPLHGAGYEQAWSIGLRIGAVLGLYWLAYPEIQRVPGWLWFVVPLELLAAVIRPLRWTLLLLVPLAILLALSPSRKAQPEIFVGSQKVVGLAALDPPYKNTNDSPPLSRPTPPRQSRRSSPPAP